MKIYSIFNAAPVKPVKKKKLHITLNQKMQRVLISDDLVDHAGINGGIYIVEFKGKWYIKPVPETDKDRIKIVTLGKSKGFYLSREVMALMGIAPEGSHKKEVHSVPHSLGPMPEQLVDCYLIVL